MLAIQLSLKFVWDFVRNQMRGLYANFIWAYCVGYPRAAYLLYGSFSVDIDIESEFPRVDRCFSIESAPPTHF